MRSARRYSLRSFESCKLLRETAVVAVADNPRLRAIMDKALAANMTRDTIDRAVARGAGTVRE